MEFRLTQTLRQHGRNCKTDFHLTAELETQAMLLDASISTEEDSKEPEKGMHKGINQRNFNILLFQVGCECLNSTVKYVTCLQCVLCIGQQRSTSDIKPGNNESQLEEVL